MKDSLLLLSSFMKNPREIISVAPSSKFVIDEVLKNIDFKNAKYIVEYGAGTGCITIEMLKRARKDTKILCFDVNKKFCSYLRKNINDKRVIIINDNAENIKKYLKKLDIQKIDYVISGLPFSILPDNQKIVIIEETKKTLRIKGRFVIYQYLNSIKKYLKHYFSKISTSFIPFNIPPCFVYVCEK